MAKVKKLRSSTPNKHLETLFREANTAFNRGLYENALELYKKILEVQPANSTIWHFSGLCNFHLQRYDVAIEAMRKALNNSATFSSTILIDLGVTYARRGQHEEARACWNSVLNNDKHNISALTYCAKSFLTQSLHDDARSYCQQILRLQPDNIEILLYLSAIEQRVNPRLAKQYLKQLLKLDPNNFSALAMLQEVHSRLLEVRDTALIQKRIISIGEKYNSVFSAYLMMLHYDDALSPEYIYQEHRRWGSQFDSDLRLNAVTEPDPNKTLRIGFVSGDYSFHPVMDFLYPILDRKDTKSYEFYLYGDVTSPDKMTQNVIQLGHQWRDIRGLNDDEAAQLVVEDKIDILIDLSGHTGNNRLKIFAKKPAPVQITYLGYPDTTGLMAIDYRITDAFSDPVGTSEKYHTEKLLRLPKSFLCYRATHQIDSSQYPPSEKVGHIVFGCFNNYFKLSEHCLMLFAMVLKAIPDSYLVLKTSQVKNDNASDIVRERITTHGVDGKRIIFADHIPSRHHHIAFYNSIDIALDAYPYNGTTTTCEAFYMGVPVISRTGKNHCSRVGSSLLHAVGLSDLASDSDEGFIKAAVSLASDRSRLKEIKLSLRQKMLSTSLGNASIFLPQFDAMLRDTWATWCHNNMDVIIDKPHLPDKKEIDLPDTRSTLLLRVPGDIDIVLPNDVKNFTTYSLLELEDWHELEIEFIRSLLKPGDSAIDFGPGYGIYALSLAKTTNTNGKIFCFEPNPEISNLILKSAEINNMPQIEIVKSSLSNTQRSVYITHNPRVPYNVISDYFTENSANSDCDTLDCFIAGKGVKNIDFIRVSATGPDGGRSIQHQIVLGGTRFFGEHSPLVMIKVRDEIGSKIYLPDKLIEMGYQSYRYLDSLNALVPYSKDEALDSFVSILFFCKQNRAELLAKRNLLVMNRSSPQSLLSVPLLDWRQVLVVAPFTKQLINGWLSNADEGLSPAWSQYEHALNLYLTGAYNPDISLALRFTLLESAFVELSAVVGQYATIPRLFTCARVASAIGFREMALKLVAKSYMTLVQNVDIKMLEPFVPACPRYDELEIGLSNEKWLRACSAEAVESYGYRTSFEMGIVPLNKLDLIYSMEFHSIELERRRILIRYKEGLTSGLTPNAMFKSASKSNLNIDLWKKVTANKKLIQRSE